MNKKKETMLYMGVGGGLGILFLAFYIIHVKYILYITPGMNTMDGLNAGIEHIMTAPFEFEIVPGTIRLIFSILAGAGLVFFMMMSNAKLKAHYDPKTVQGDAKWMKDKALIEYNKKFTEPFGKPSNNGKNNNILSREMALSLNNQKTRRNSNIFLIGGSGAGKTYTYIGPNLLQANTSFVVTDPAGGTYKEYGKYLEHKGYTVKCFNLAHMDKGSHYNPFHYITSDKDIAILVTTLIKNTTPPDQHGGDPFWENAEKELLMALIAYLWHYSPKEDQTFSNVMKLLRSAIPNEADTTNETPLDVLFEDVRKKHGDHEFAYKQYQIFKMAGDKTASSILVSTAVRLNMFDIVDVERLTSCDTIDLDSIGDEKTALFVIIPTGDTTFSALAALMYTQMFQRLYRYCEDTAEYGQLLMDGEDQVIKTFRAKDATDSKRAEYDAKAFLDRAKSASIVYNDSCEWYELRTEKGEMVAHRSSEEEAKKALELIKNGYIMPNKKQSNHGQRLPIHLQMLLDEFANTGKIPEFSERVATIRKYSISTVVILQSLQQMQNLYEKDWNTIIGNSDTLVYLGGGADQVTTEFISKLLGKETRVVRNLSFNGNSGGSTSYNLQGVELYTPAQLRTLPEDECIVIPKSLDAFKGLKYKTEDHPERKTQLKLNENGEYYFSTGKERYLLKEKERFSLKENASLLEELQPTSEDNKKENDQKKKQNEVNVKEVDDGVAADGEELIGSVKDASEGMGMTSSQDVEKAERRARELNDNYQKAKAKEKQKQIIDHLKSESATSASSSSGTSQNTSMPYENDEIIDETTNDYSKDIDVPIEELMFSTNGIDD